MILVRGKLPKINGHCIDGHKRRVTITTTIVTLLLSLSDTKTTKPIECFVLRFEVRLQSDNWFINFIKKGRCGTCLGRCTPEYQCKACHYDRKTKIMQHDVELGASFCHSRIGKIMHELMHVVGK